MKFFCEYCGCRIDSDTDDKCPNCGASYKKNKTFIELENKKKDNQEFKDQLRMETYNQFKSGLKVSKVISIFVVIFIFIVFTIIFTGIVTTFINVSKNDNHDFTNTQDDIKKGSFNSALEMYTGENYGMQVKYLLEEVITKNKTVSDHSIYVVYDNYNTNDTSQITSLKQTLDDWQEYEVSADYDSNGYINKITILSIK